MFCQKCGGKNVADARFCGSCGTSLKRSRSSSRKVWLWIGIFVSVFVVAGVGYILIHVVNEKKIGKVTEKPQEVAQIEKPVVQAIVLPSVKKEKSFEKEKTAVIKDSMPKVYTILTQDGLGSGFFYKKGGLIVTNAHVVAGFTEVSVRNSNGKDSHGQVIGISDHYDIALIRAADYANVEPLPTERKES